MGKPTNEERALRAKLAEQLKAEWPKGEIYFNARREAMAALVAAEDAFKAIVDLEGYAPWAQMIDHAAIIGFAGIRRTFCNTVPEGAMAASATMLADSQDPYFARWKDAEPFALARVLIGDDGDMLARTLAAADEQGRTVEAFKAARYTEPRAPWTLLHKILHGNPKSE